MKKSEYPYGFVADPVGMKSDIEKLYQYHYYRARELAPRGHVAAKDLEKYNYHKGANEMLAVLYTRYFGGNAMMGLFATSVRLKQKKED